MGGFTCVPSSLPVVSSEYLPSSMNRTSSRDLQINFFQKCTKGTFISFEETKKYLTTKKILHTGNPLRKRLAQYEGTKKAEGTFGIFVFGGSRGARSINDAVLTLLPHLESYKNTVMLSSDRTGGF